VADVDSALEQEIFYLSQRQRITDVHHHREADHLGRRVEITEWIAHRRRLRNAPARFKPICIDTAIEQLQAHIETGIDRIIFVPYRYEMEQVEAIATDIIPKLRAG
jgi:hypothetical protein